MIAPDSLPISEVNWPDARRIIRSRHPPIDLFEDIADPEDWPLLIAAEQRTNPRLLTSIGNLDQVPPERRVAGHGASFLMAPFTHVSTDWPSRYSDGSFGVLYVGREFETALFETVYRHELFMSATSEAPGWTSRFRELTLDVNADLHDATANTKRLAGLRDSSDYRVPQQLGAALRQNGSDGVLYPSSRYSEGQCAALFYPDLASKPQPGRRLDYHWNGERVDYVRELRRGKSRVYEIVEFVR